MFVIIVDVHSGDDVDGVNFHQLSSLLVHPPGKLQIAEHTRMIKKRL